MNAEDVQNIICNSERIEDYFYLRLSERGMISEEAGKQARERLADELKNEVTANTFKAFADTLIDSM